MSTYGVVSNTVNAVSAAIELAQEVTYGTWGIYRQDANYHTFDIETKTVLGVEIKHSGKVVNAAVEQGSFASYNKVEEPISLTYTIGISGTDEELGEVLDNLSEWQSGTDLFIVVTPCDSFQDLNLTAYNYGHKRENGVGVLWLELQFQQIKQVESESTVGEYECISNGKVQTGNISLLKAGFNRL